MWFVCELFVVLEYVYLIVLGCVDVVCKIVGGEIVLSVWMIFVGVVVICYMVLELIEDLEVFGCYWICFNVLLDKLLDVVMVVLNEVLFIVCL